MNDARVRNIEEYPQLSAFASRNDYAGLYYFSKDEMFIWPP